MFAPVKSASVPASVLVSENPVPETMPETVSVRPDGTLHDWEEPRASGAEIDRLVAVVVPDDMSMPTLLNAAGDSVMVPVPTVMP